jgi:hypothetical protein
MNASPGDFSIDDEPFFIGLPPAFDIQAKSACA